MSLDCVLALKMTVRGFEWIAVALAALLILLLIMRIIRGARQRTRAGWRADG